MPLNVPLRWLRALLRQWPLLASAIVAAAIVHIIVTLTSAQFARARSYELLTHDLPVNTVTFAPLVTEKTQPLPYFNPDALYAYCHYDASTSRIRVSAHLPETGWSLSIHTPRGQNFYYVPGTDQRPTDLELVLAPPGKVFAHTNLEVERANEGIPVVKLPDVEGVVILRAPLKGLAYRRVTDEERSRFKCWPEAESNIGAARP